MMRFLVIAALLTIGVRWVLGKWPWEYLSGTSSRSQSLSNARKLLSVESGASREDILAAHKRVVAIVHPDRGGSNAAVHDANAARDLLLDELPPRLSE